MSADQQQAWAAIRSAEGLNGWRADEPELAEDDEFGRWLVVLRLVVGDEWGYHVEYAYGVDAEDARAMALWAVECAEAAGGTRQ